jgi:hypothetical protein
MDKGTFVRSSSSERTKSFSSFSCKRYWNHPPLCGTGDFIDKIPNDAEVIFLPQNDPELCEVNRRLGKAREKEGRKVV